MHAADLSDGDQFGQEVDGREQEQLALVVEAGWQDPGHDPVLAEDGPVEPQKIHTVAISTRYPEPLKVTRSKEHADCNQLPFECKHGRPPDKNQDGLTTFSDILQLKEMIMKSQPPTFVDVPLEAQPTAGDTNLGGEGFGDVGMNV